MPGSLRYWSARPRRNWSTTSSYVVSWTASLHGVEERRGGRHQGRFVDAFGPEGSQRLTILYTIGVDRRHIADGQGAEECPSARRHSR